jgi:hypothetical protein
MQGNSEKEPGVLEYAQRIALLIAMVAFILLVCTMLNLVLMPHPGEPFFTPTPIGTPTALPTITSVTTP